MLQLQNPSDDLLIKTTDIRNYASLGDVLVLEIGRPVRNIIQVRYTLA